MATITTNLEFVEEMQLVYRMYTDHVAKVGRGRIMAYNKDGTEGAIFRDPNCWYAVLRYSVSDDTIHFWHGNGHGRINYRKRDEYKLSDSYLDSRRNWDPIAKTIVDALLLRLAE